MMKGWGIRFLCAAFLLVLAASSGQAGAPQACDFGDVRLMADFPTARVNDCRQEGGDIHVLISPETSPINPSPWYAFRLEADRDREVSLVLRYAQGSDIYKHRYWPKLSADGLTWTAAAPDQVTVSDDKNRAHLRLTLKKDQPLWVAAQEILTGRQYTQWMAGLAKRHDFLDLSRLGKSTEGRDIFKLENRPAKPDAEVVLLIGRQHPPEVTGTLAMLAFTETLFADTDLAQRFRKHFRIIAVPNLNPDGVANGHWRANVNGRDLNRDWGPFTQVETQAMKAELDRIAAAAEQGRGGRLALMLDFHSTWKNLIYTQTAAEQTRPIGFAEAWHRAIRERVPDQPLALEPRKLSAKATSKNYVYRRFGVPAITYEMADRADRDGLVRQARAAAEEMMKILLNAPAADTQDLKTPVDLAIFGDKIYTGATAGFEKGVLVIDGGKIVYRGPDLPDRFAPKRRIEAGDHIVAPGFIDPHTHACEDFKDRDGRANLNYLTQGVTTVFCGNDGGGPVDVGETLAGYDAHGIGGNVALYVGHGSVRRAVMGTEDRAPTPAELNEMETLVAQAMRDGALGLSTGLYYVPGAYADSEEVVALAKVAARHGGAYDSHIRDESSYTVGLLAAIREVIDIGRAAKLPVHIAHIKALGVDVWNKSRDIVAMVERARADGVKVTADQYPWAASGTSVAGALMPRWVMAGSKDKYRERLQDPALAGRIRAEMTDNLRRRGGAKALLITDPRRPELRGRTLEDIAAARGLDPVSAALEIVRAGNARVASFNMSADDIRRFMRQPWVMTSSDGSTGHPRKYASFPKKYAAYVVQEGVLPLPDFLYRSSGLAAETFGLTDRGRLQPGAAADIVIFDPETFRPRADYMAPEALSEGVEWLLVNGRIAIDNGRYTGILAGRALKKQSTR